MVGKWPRYSTVGAAPKRCIISETYKETYKNRTIFRICRVKNPYSLFFSRFMEPREGWREGVSVVDAAGMARGGRRHGRNLFHNYPIVRVLLML